MTTGNMNFRRFLLCNNNMYMQMLADRSTGMLLHRHADVLRLRPVWHMLYKHHFAMHEGELIFKGLPALGRKT